MSEIIYQDENGIETSRKVKGKGRPPKGAVRLENGDLVVKVGVVVPSVLKEDYIKPMYITLDSLGNEIEPRISKGRGRPKPGYAKETDGPNTGHWVKVIETPKVETPVETIVKTEDVIPV